MASDPFDISLTAGATKYGFMLVRPPGQSKQLNIDEVGGPSTLQQQRRIASDAADGYETVPPEQDVPFAMDNWSAGAGQLTSDGNDENAYWWGSAVVTHLDGRVYLAPPQTNLTLPSSAGTGLNGMMTFYHTASLTRYDFAWEGPRLYRRNAANSTNAWSLVYTQPNAKVISNFDVFNGVGVIAVASLTDAIGGDFYTQADVTAAATWTPSLRNHSPFSDANGRPKQWCPVRGTLFALVDNARVYFTVDPTVDGWVGPITTTVGTLSNPDVGEASYPFTNAIAINDFLLTFKMDSGYNIDSEQAVTEVIWQWKDKPRPDNFQYVATDGQFLYYAVAGEVYYYDPGTGASSTVKLARHDGFSCKQILGLSADSQYIYVLARVRVPYLRSADSVALLRLYKATGARWLTEVLWEDQTVTETYSGLVAVPSATGTRVYWGVTTGGATSTNVMDVLSDWDESTGSSFATSGSLYTSVTRENWPSLIKRHMYCSMETEGTTSSSLKVEVAYSVDNGQTFTVLGDTDVGAVSTLISRFSYPALTSRSIVLRFNFTGTGTATPILRVFDTHARVRFRYLQSITAAVRVGDFIERDNGTRSREKATDLKTNLETLRLYDGTMLYEDFLGNSFVVSLDKLAYHPTRHETPETKYELEAQATLIRADAGL